MFDFFSFGNALEGTAQIIKKAPFALQHNVFIVNHRFVGLFLAQVCSSIHQMHSCKEKYSTNFAAKAKQSASRSHQSLQSLGNIGNSGSGKVLSSLIPNKNML